MWILEYENECDRWEKRDTDSHRVPRKILKKKVIHIHVLASYTQIDCKGAIFKTVVLFCGRNTGKTRSQKRGLSTNKKFVYGKGSIEI